MVMIQDIVSKNLKWYEKYDLIIDKGVSDTFQYRRSSKNSVTLLSIMFNNINKLL